MRRRRRVLLALLLLGFLWTAGFVAFVARMPYEEEPADLRPLDGVVVLTGGRQRVERGLALLSEGKAKKLLVSGVHREVNLPELLRVSPRMPEWIECCVELGHAALDTMGNARETADWVRRNGFRSIRLVTADYHMPRSLVETRRVMPEIEIVPHPVFPEKTLGLLLVEYHKWAASLLRSLVG